MNCRQFLVLIGLVVTIVPDAYSGGKIKFPCFYDVSDLSLTRGHQYSHGSIEACNLPCYHLLNYNTELLCGYSQFEYVQQLCR